MSSFPYVPPASIFNTLDYRIVEDSGITLAEADARYFRITGGYVPYINSSEFYLNGSPLNFTLLTDITAGTVQANKLIAVDSNRDITNFRNISLSGTLIASNDISSPIINSNQYLLSGSSILTSALTGIVTGTASASKALVLDSSSNIVGINSLSATNLLVSGNAILSGIITLTNTTAATNNSNGAIQMSGGLSISNSTNATSSINGGSITTAGGVAIAKQLFVGTSITTPSISTSSLNSTTIDANIATIAIPLVISHLLSSGVPTVNSFGVGMNFNGPNSISSTVSYGRIYSTIQSTTNGSHQGSLTFASVFSGAFQDVMTLSSSAATNNLVDIKGSASTLSVPNILTTTINSTSGTISIGSKLNVNSPTSTNSIINIQSAALTSHLNFAFDTNHYAYMSCGFDSRYTITVNSLLSTPQYHQYWFDSPEYCSVPRLSLSGFAIPASIGTNFRLQFGNTTGDIMIALYNANTVSPTYGFGVNNSSIQYVSAGSNGHRFFSSSALAGAGAPIGVGTNVFNIQANGNAISQRNLFSGAGVHAFGYDTTDLSAYGDGVHLHYAAGHGSVFAYNYSAGSYRDIEFNNNSLYIKASNSFIGIGTTSPSCPLHIVGTGLQSTASSFGWLSGAGTGIATAFTNRPFSIRCSNGILCDSGEIDVLSDIRLKSNIQKLDKNLCLSFIQNITPISFNYSGIKNDKKHYGYSAQELMEYGFESIVGYTNDENPLLSECIIDCINKSKIKLDKHTRLVVSLLDIIPILHQTIKLQQDTIDKILAKLESDPMDPTPAKLKRVVKKVKKPIIYSSK